MKELIVTYFFERPTDFLLALFSGLLTLFTWRVWVSTNRLFQVTKAAADAADQTARAAIGIELPILRVHGIPIALAGIEEGTDLSTNYSSVPLDGFPGRHSVVSDITVKNFGRTHAFPIEIALGYAVTNSLSAGPAYRQILKPPVGSVIPPNETVTMPIHFGIHLSAKEEAAVQSKRTPLWFYFSVAYRDFMDKRREARFCYQWARPDNAGAFYFAEGDAPIAYTLHT